MRDPPDPLLTEISQCCEENSLVKPTGRTYVDLFGKVTYVLNCGRSTQIGIVLVDYCTSFSFSRNFTT